MLFMVTVQYTHVTEPQTWCTRPAAMRTKFRCCGDRGTKAEGVCPDQGSPLAVSHGWGVGGGAHGNRGRRPALKHVLAVLQSSELGSRGGGGGGGRWRDSLGNWGTGRERGRKMIISMTTQNHSTSDASTMSI